MSAYYYNRYRLENAYVLKWEWRKRRKTTVPTLTDILQYFLIFYSIFITHCIRSSFAYCTLLLLLFVFFLRNHQNRTVRKRENILSFYRLILMYTLCAHVRNYTHCIPSYLFKYTHQRVMCVWVLCLNMDVFYTVIHTCRNPKVRQYDVPTSIIHNFVMLKRKSKK